MDFFSGCDFFFVETGTNLKYLFRKNQNNNNKNKKKSLHVPQMWFLANKYFMCKERRTVTGDGKAEGKGNGNK